MKSFSFASGPPPVAECVLGAQLTLSKVAKRAQAFLRKWRFRLLQKPFRRKRKAECLERVLTGRVNRHCVRWLCER